VSFETKKTASAWGHGIFGYKGRLLLVHRLQPRDERKERIMPAIDRIMFEELFTDEVLTPTQFFGRTSIERMRRTGECQLLAALLADAIRCYKRNYFAVSRTRRRLFREAEQWLMEPAATDGSGPAFSFLYVCDVLGIEPEAVRAALRRWREAQNPQPNGSDPRLAVPGHSRKRPRTRDAA
jgi:hypothetical protein